MGQMHDVSKESFLAALRRDGRAFRDAVPESDLAAPVPSCPEWTVRDLVAHVARVYEFVIRVHEQAPAKPLRNPIEPGPDGVLPWFDAFFAALVDRLEATDSDAPMWNWSTQPDVAEFWPRRMAHETAVHHWDARMVSGLAEPVEADIAADGVSEVLDTWLPAGRAVNHNGATGLVRLSAFDHERTWLVRLRPEGMTLADESALINAETEAQTGVGGTASDLLLALWGRLTPAVLTIEGDPALFDALVTG